MLALPSGSKPNRTRGSEIHIDAADNFLGSREIDFLPLFSFLSERIPDLNIEGGVISGDTVSLFQRGNGKAGFNGIVQFGLEYLQELLHGQFNPEPFNPRVIEIQLPQVDGVNLTFTDACTHEGQIYFAAAAERGASTYEDGEVIGSAIGRMGSSPVILEQINRIKVEGLAVAASEARAMTFYAVTDADDPHIPSQLIELCVPQA